ncbi:MAG: VOC family protein [Alphaproteobacteria bacterium]|nr:VOC family protein [Alphaproteobacteria bacterium]
MSDALSPLWPARLHHIRRNSDQPERLVDFFREGLQLSVEALADQVWLLRGRERRVLIGHGAPASLGFAGFVLETADQLAAFRTHVEGQGLTPAASPSPLLDGDAFSLADPDGNRLAFGLPPIGDEAPAGDGPLAGRLQHFVVASSGLDPMIAFYRDQLGFLVSDYVLEEGGEVTACFLRSDPEHHSFAVFRAPEARLDHHAYETTGWLDIRDWADHFAALRVPLWWGPGRHGVGNNLFFMVEDPDGSKVELSAELEICPPEQDAGEWEHGERALNLWGSAWMRS